jgi:signal peptidase I
MIGLGQLYVGRVKRAVLYLLSFELLQLLVVLLVSAVPPAAKLATLLLAMAFLVAFGLVATVDAFLLAKRLGRGDFEKRRSNRLVVYIAFFLAGAISIFFLAQMERRVFFEVYRVPGSSMMPVLLGGDYIVANKQADCLDCAGGLQAGEVIIFKHEGTTRIKRLVGLPGDTIEIKNQVLMVNGVSVRGSPIEKLEPEELNSTLKMSYAYEERLGSRSYVTFWPRRSSEDVAKLQVPEGMVYVLGDNRTFSRDSRKMGFIPVSELRGRVEQLWYSRDPERRAGRVGKVL